MTAHPDAGCSASISVGDCLRGGLALDTAGLTSYPHHPMDDLEVRSHRDTRDLALVAVAVDCRCQLSPIAVADPAAAPVADAGAVRVPAPGDN